MSAVSAARASLAAVLLRWISRIQEVLSRSRFVVLAAVAIRRAMGGIIGHRLRRGGIDPELNGEGWLQSLLADRCEVFVDVGANTGEWSAAMLQLSPRARGILYEPAAPALARLRERFSDDDRIEIVDAAVSDAPGTAAFYEEPAAGETSSLVAEHSVSGSTRREVRVVTLDEELSRRGVEHVDLLKIDAEGFDLMALRGATDALRSGRIDVVQFEYNAPWAVVGATLTAAQRLLSECGFTLYALRQGALGTVPLDWLGELFMYANFVGVSAAAHDRLRVHIVGDALS